ncbi:MAG: hypothetical protein QOJ84_4093 [Bradyrhizobium sp.]|jgi:hypothetical protein|nr:hypothetical protein [Bradyrhizobium sp.]
MQGLLLGSWGPQIVAYSQQYPWRIFAAVLVGILLLDLMFRGSRGTGRQRRLRCWRWRWRVRD